MDEIFIPQYLKDSQGELRIQTYLESHGKNIKQQHVVDGVGTFDFVTYHRGLVLIEYQGLQHYIPSSFGYKKKEKFLQDFCRCLRNDYRKIEYCRSKGVKLIIIPYWDFRNIDKILDQFFSDCDVQFAKPPKKVDVWGKMRKSIREKLKIDFEILCGVV